MSTCVKIIFREENDGVDVRVGYDKTPYATKTELNYATVFAKQIGEIVRNMSCAQDLTQKWRRDTGNAAAMREALERILDIEGYGAPWIEAKCIAQKALEGQQCTPPIAQKTPKSEQPGNAAAMREALVGVLSALEDAGFHPYVYGDPLAEAVLKARAALDALATADGGTK